MVYGFGILAARHSVKSIRIYRVKLAEGGGGGGGGGSLLLSPRNYGLPALRERDAYLVRPSHNFQGS